ncbi:hypothetical protein Hanom_Chr16g01470071 [Helianthus anomalus]
MNFGTKFHFKLGMMWHLRKIRSHLDFFSPHSSGIAHQISGRNFFQVRNDLTTRTLKVSFV